MPKYPRFFIDPAARLDWSWDWSGWLAAGETITSASVTAGTFAGTVDQVTHDDTTVTAWVSGATTSGTIDCHVVTSAGREDSRAIFLAVSDL